MPYIETPADLADALANELGIYGACPDGEHDGKACRSCWVADIAIRIRQAAENEKLLAAPQAQEEPSGAPACRRCAKPAKIWKGWHLCDECSHRYHPAGFEDEVRPKPPAPASPGGLVWTPGFPKVSGWYLCRPPTAGSDQDVWQGVHVDVDRNGFVLYWDEKAEDWLPAPSGQEWAGPISPAAPEAGAPGTPCPGIVSKDCTGWTCTYSKEGICLTCGGKRPQTQEGGSQP